MALFASLLLSFLKIFYLLFIHWLHWVSLAARRRTLAEERRGYPLAAVSGAPPWLPCGLLAAVASLVSEHSCRRVGPSSCDT